MQQNKFIQGLNEALLSNAEIDNVIIGGDWNVTLERIDKKGGGHWKPTPYRDKLLLMMEELNLSKKRFYVRIKISKSQIKNRYFSGVNFHYEIGSCYRLKNLYSS